MEFEVDLLEDEKSSVVERHVPGEKPAAIPILCCAETCPEGAGVQQIKRVGLGRICQWRNVG
jgi:hypothetical protein